MNPPSIDPETLASLLDGRLDERRRAEVLERLALSEEELEAFADAVAVTHELEAEEAEAAESESEGVMPLRPRREIGGSGWSWRWLAMAAVLVLLALVPWAWLRTRAPEAPADPGRYVSLLDAPEAGLPAGWDDRPWTVTRSAADPLSPEARAVRLGARLVDLELAVRAEDPAAARLSGEIVALLDAIPAAGPVAAIYREVGRRVGEPRAELESLLAQGGAAVLGVADEEFVLLGAWAEAARVAAARHDARFFHSPDTRQTLDRAAGLPNLDGPARAAVERVRTRLPLPAAPDWTALEAEVTGLLQIAGT